MMSMEATSGRPTPHMSSWTRRVGHRLAASAEVWLLHLCRVRLKTVGASGSVALGLPFDRAFDSLAVEERALAGA